MGEANGKSTDLVRVPLVGAAPVLVDHVARGQPVDRRVEDGHHHPTGEPLLLPQPVEVTVAHLNQKVVINSCICTIHYKLIWIRNDNTIA